jgi:alkylhydroperoxidase family enzyme
MIQIKDNDTGQRKQRSQDTTFSRNKLFSTKKRAMHKALVACLLDVDGMASQAQRRAAFDNAGLDAPLSTLIDKVAMQAYKVTDEEIAAVKASGLSEDQIYELVVCAAVGQATRQYDTALAALAEATAGKGSCEHAS